MACKEKQKRRERKRLSRNTALKEKQINEYSAEAVALYILEKSVVKVIDALRRQHKSFAKYHKDTMRKMIITMLGPLYVERTISKSRNVNALSGDLDPNIRKEIFAFRAIMFGQSDDDVSKDMDVTTATVKKWTKMVSSVIHYSLCRDRAADPPYLLRRSYFPHYLINEYVQWARYWANEALYGATISCTAYSENMVTVEYPSRTLVYKLDGKLPVLRYRWRKATPQIAGSIPATS